MALRLIAMALRTPAGARAFSYADKIGKREIVGYGCNGLPVYVDRVDYPMPAIRFKEDTPEILVIFFYFAFLCTNQRHSFCSNSVQRKKETGINCRSMKRKLCTAHPSVKLLRKLKPQLVNGNSVSLVFLLLPHWLS